VDRSTIILALSRLGGALHAESPDVVEVLLVGGAAGMLTEVLPSWRTTGDCDVMVHAPEDALGRLCMAAETVAAEMGLPPNWLNTDVQIRRDALPDGWEERAKRVGQWGALRVLAIGRADLIAMKTLAGRAQDLSDLQALRPTADEWMFVRAYLASLPAKGTHPEQIAEALAVLREFEGRGHD
jgi:hypothetical protein